MNLFEANLRLLQKYLNQVATVKILAYPHFLLECCLAILIATIYLYLTFEVAKIYRHTVKLRPYTIHLRRTLKASSSKESITTSITRIHHECCKLDVMKTGANRKSITTLDWTTWNNAHRSQAGDCCMPLPEEGSTKKLLSEKIAAMTPMQFVRLDRERQLRDRQVKGCMQSLTTLFDNVRIGKYPEANLKEQLEQAKEETEYSRVSDQVIKYLDSESVTDSLINVLNEIIEDSTSDNPLPLKGDITSLVYDIGNLKEKSSLIFDTKCDLVQSSSTSTTTESANPINEARN